MRNPRTITTTTLAVLACAAVAAPAAAAAPTAAAAQVREYEGVITSVDRSKRTFRLRDSERGTVRIRVTSRTRFERIAGFSALKVGMRDIEATVRRVKGGWVATEVERSGGGGRHGGHGRGEGDDD